MQTQIMRFNPDASTIEDAAIYLTERAIQLLKHGFILQSLESLDKEAVLAKWKIIEINQNHVDSEGIDLTNTTGEFASIYLLKQYRGNGRYVKLVQEIGLPILTHQDCHLIHFLQTQKIPFLVCWESNTWNQIAKYYGDRKAERSQVWLMRHIDEGLAILYYLHSSEIAYDGFCLHPLVQKNQDLVKNWPNIFSLGPSAILAMEYRAVANAALSDRIILNASAIQLSPIALVNDMLVADKVQNRKDFELYHKNTHPRSEILDRYFKLWLERLSVPENMYQTWISNLIHPMNVLQTFLKTIAEQ